jgi:hypothetical protein
MPKKAIDYSNCCIYKIEHIDKDDLVYVGHTTNFTKRKNSHKSCCNNENKQSKLYQLIRDNGGFEMFRMIELEKYPCKDRREAEKRECEVMKELKAELNSMISYVSEEIKKKYIKDFCKEYYDKNKDKIKERIKNYSQANQDKIKEKSKIYREANNEEIKVYLKTYRETNKDKRKEYNLLNKDKIKEQQKQYGKANKDKIKEKQREYRNNNKDLINEKRRIKYQKKKEEKANKL